MSVWKTLHFFDSEKYFEEIVPKVKRFHTYYSNFFESDLAKYVRRKTTISQLQSFIDNLSEDLKRHKTLFEIATRTKKRDQPYLEFIRQKSKEEEEFNKLNEPQFETFSNLLVFIVFQECAAFNPHLILGRSIFGGHIKSDKGSITEEICSKITTMDFYTGEWYSTFTNWVTKEEAELLLMDFQSIKPKQSHSERYYNDFRIFLETAVENSYGFIAGQNLNEELITLIEQPIVKVELDMKKLNLQSVIEYK